VKPATAELVLRNRQRTRALSLSFLRRIARHLLEHEFACRQFELAVHLVARPEMTRLNEHYLRHAGATDVITFDYADDREAARSPASARANAASAKRPEAPRALWGEIFICMDAAVTQAQQYRTNWPEEVARYLIHGLLHLHGHDDLRRSARQAMKREENRLLRQVRRRFALRRLINARSSFNRDRTTRLARH
jgi:probable rRNA maturation factor